MHDKWKMKLATYSEGVSQESRYLNCFLGSLGRSIANFTLLPEGGLFLINFSSIYYQPKYNANFNVQSFNPVQFLKNFEAYELSPIS